MRIKRIGIIASIVAAGLLGVALTAGTSHAAPQAPAANYHAVERISPFTGKPTHIYAVQDGLYYFLWEYYPNEGYCAYDDGAYLDLYSGCDTAYQNDMWHVGTWSGGSWSGWAYIQSQATGNCIDDPGGDNNIRVQMHSCGEVGGMSWEPYLWNNNGNFVTVTNAYTAGSSTEEDTTLSFGTAKDGAWIVTEHQGAGLPPTDERWADLGL
jgi:hypothetical protein